jgi:hypothetical protein
MSTSFLEPVVLSRFMGPFPRVKAKMVTGDAIAIA